LLPCKLSAISRAWRQAADVENSKKQHSSSNDGGGGVAADVRVIVVRDEQYNETTGRARSITTAADPSRAAHLCSCNWDAEAPQHDAHDGRVHSQKHIVNNVKHVR
jgi:hypothetical protein